MKFSYLFIRNKPLFSDFMRLSLPALGNDVVWGVGFAMYSVIIDHMGTDAVAANSFVVVVRTLVRFCALQGKRGRLLLGQKIGTDQLEAAAANAKKRLRLTVITGVVGGLIVLAATPLC